MEGARRRDALIEGNGSILHQLVEPWYSALAEPEKAQEAALKGLLEGYSKTRYGIEKGASSIKGVSEYREAFPTVRYSDLSGPLSEVIGGDYTALLPEPPKSWVMTRGTTGASKVLPATETHLSLILSMGARAVVNFALKTDATVLEAPVLNLNFPSKVQTMQTSGVAQEYGYSSGTYARLFPELQGARLVPKQEQIDSLGGGVGRDDWERRFELVYQASKDEDVGSLMGVTPVMLSFASYVKRAHSRRPRDFWKPRALFCTSVAKIHTRYEPELRHNFGPSPVVEMYTATEGVFAQQLDHLPYVSPNYDGYFFEVSTRTGIKMLHELRAGEWGSLIISTPVLPRYAIGDLIEAVGKGYFRVFGRNRSITRLEHLLFRAASFRF